MKLNFKEATEALEKPDTITYVFGKKNFKERAISALKSFALTTVISAMSFQAFAQGKHEHRTEHNVKQKVTISQPNKQAKNNKKLVEKVSREELILVQREAKRSLDYNLPISISETDNNIDLAQKYYEKIKNSKEGDDRVINYAMCIALANEGYSEGKKLDAQHHLTTGYGYDMTVQKRDYGIKKVAYDLAKAGVDVDQIVKYTTGKSKTMPLTKEQSVRLMKTIMPSYAQFAKSWAGPEIWGLDNKESKIFINDNRIWNTNAYLEKGGIYKSVYLMDDIQKAAVTYAAYNTGTRAIGNDFRSHWMKGDVIGAVSSIKVTWKDKSGEIHLNQRLMNNVAIAFNGHSTIQTVLTGTSDRYMDVDQVSALSSISPDSVKAMKFETAYKKSISKLATLDALKAQGKELTKVQEKIYNKEKSVALKTFASVNEIKEKLGEETLRFYNPFLDVIQFKSTEELAKEQNKNDVQQKIKQEDESRKFAERLYNKLEQAQQSLKEHSSKPVLNNKSTQPS